MTIYDFLLDVLGDGEFSIPFKDSIVLGDGGTLETQGILRGTVVNGFIRFSDPMPKVKAYGCKATVQTVEPLAPDAAVVTAKAPFLSPIKKVWRIEDPT